MQRSYKKLIYVTIIIGLLSLLLSCHNVEIPSDLEPVGVVKLYFDAFKNGNWDSWLSTMTEDKKQGFSEKFDLNSGLILFKINEIYEYEEGHEERRNHLDAINRAIENSEETEKIDDGNIAFVYVDFTTDYRNPKSPPVQSAEWVFTLIREDSDSPWLIQSWGYGYGGAGL